MITHRLQTRPAAEAPVRFYKIIALSLFGVSLLLLSVVIFTTTKKATITIMAKEDTKNVNLVIGLAKQKQGDKEINGIVSSTIFSWTQTYYPTNAKAVDGVASGEAIIYNKSKTAQPLVKTTRLLRADGILFRLTEGIVVPPEGQITAKVYADAAGPTGDIEPSKFSIPGLNEARQTQVFAESLAAMSGGVKKVKVLTEEDLKSAKADYAEKVKQAFLSASSTPEDQWLGQKLVTVLPSEPKANNEVGSEAEQFNLTAQNTVIYILYNQEELSDVVNKELSSSIDTGSEKVLSANKEPKLSILSYDLDKKTAQISVSQDVLVTLDANAEKLALKNFMGKKKDEIERYTLGLDHVSGVEIKFSPNWMITSPSSPDKLKVIVKNVQ